MNQFVLILYYLNVPFLCLFCQMLLYMTSTSCSLSLILPGHCIYVFMQQNKVWNAPVYVKMFLFLRRYFSRLYQTVSQKRCNSSPASAEDLKVNSPSGKGGSSLTFLTRKLSTFYFLSVCNTALTHSFSCPNTCCQRAVTTKLFL